MILTGEGEEAFCSGGDQKLRGEGGYDDGTEEAPRLTVLDLHVQMRRCPKPIIAMVAGRWGVAWGGAVSPRRRLFACLLAIRHNPPTCPN